MNNIVVRYIAYMVSFLVVVFIAIPCNDHMQAYAMQKSEIVHNTTDHNEDSHQHQGTGHCSPFCVCQCCQTIFTLTSPVILSPSNPIAVNYYEHFYNLNSAELFELPKPPKV